MQYVGSKNKIAKHLLPVMLAERKSGQWWVEPFVGGANMIDKVDGPRIGNDSHEYLVALLKSIRDGYAPPTDVCGAFYYTVKNHPDIFPAELVGFIGFLCSYGGKWWGGYAFNNTGTNYAKRGNEVLTKQAKKLNGVIFRCGSYLNLDIPKNSLIYCDPPYEGTTRYRDRFDHKAFWDWCRNKVKEGHTVFISEYSAPNDFECIKEVNIVSMLNKKPWNNLKTERLYKHVSQRRPQNE